MGLSISNNLLGVDVALFLLYNTIYYYEGEAELYEKLPHDHGQKDIQQLQLEIDKIENFQIISEIFGHLGDTTRVRLFWMLCHVEQCVLNISTIMKMSSPAISHHLRSLKAAGLVTSRREGKEVYYRAADTKEARLLHSMIEQVMQISCPN